MSSKTRIEPSNNTLKYMAKTLLTLLSLIELESSHLTILLEKLLVIWLYYLEPMANSISL
jgi:hypothetical protein